MTADEAIDWSLAGLPVAMSLFLGVLMWDELTQIGRVLSVALLGLYVIAIALVLQSGAIHSDVTSPEALGPRL